MAVALYVTYFFIHLRQNVNVKDDFDFLSVCPFKSNPDRFFDVTHIELVHLTLI